MVEKLIELAIEIQQIPAPTFGETERGEFVRAKFAEQRLAGISQDKLGNIYARLPGKGGTAPLVIVAHLDTVFPLEANLDIRHEQGRIYGPGLGDNSLGVAALFGLVQLIRERKLDLGGDLWLVADVGEEGLGDLRGMRAVVERFGDPVLGYLILEGMALGHIYHRAVGVRRYHVTARTSGGHSWSDYGQPSAVHELARLVTQLAAIHPPVQPRTTLNVGVIGGGTTVNTLAAEAWFELDLRSEEPHALSLLAGEVENLIAAANGPGVSMEFRITSQRPAGELSPNHRFVRLALESLHEQGIDGILTTGSTDANIPLGRGIPAVVLGVTSGGGAHSQNEFIHTAPIEQGMEQIFHFVSKAWEG